MKKLLLYYSFLLAGGCLLSQQGRGQTAKAPTPGLWFSFDGTDNIPWTTATIGSATVVTYEGAPVSRVTDRLGVASRAAGFVNSGYFYSTFITADTSGNTENVKLFGYSGNSVNLPANFTISCWVFADSIYSYKIFYKDLEASKFALLSYHGSLQLRRTVTLADGGEKRFDYNFGAPAAFDAGAGWYHIILVMGVRSTDNAPYTKLYVGKPDYVKYDQTGPRQGDPTDILSSNFGGSYAFTGVQDFMNTELTSWGFGNVDMEYDEILQPIPQIDDFTVWGVALTEMQAYALFQCESVSTADQCWLASNTALAATKIVPVAVVADSVRAATNGEISVFPNPTSGELWVKLPASGKSGPVICNLLDLNGRVVYTRRVETAMAGQSILLDDIKGAARASGIYILEVIIPDRKKTIKVLVE